MVGPTGSHDHIVETQGEGGISVASGSPSRLRGITLEFGRNLSLRRNSSLLATVALLLFLSAARAPSQTCSVEPLDPDLELREESINESLGDYRVDCSGAGAGPVDMDVFFDGPFTNATTMISGREVTLAAAMIEGSNPEQLIVQVPGQPPAPGANVFLLERLDDRIGERLHVDGLPTNQPLIVSGLRGDAHAAAGGSASVLPGPAQPINTADITLSFGRNNALINFRQFPRTVSRAVLNELTEAERSLLALVRTSERQRRGYFTKAQHALPAETFSESLSADVFSLLDQQTDLVSGTRAVIAVGPGFADPTPAIVRAPREFQLGAVPRFLKPAEAPLRRNQSTERPRALQAVEGFDPSTFAGGTLVEDIDLLEVELDENGAAVLVYEVVGDEDPASPGVLEEAEITLEVACPEPTTLNGDFTLRAMLGPAPPDQVDRFLNFGTPVGAQPAQQAAPLTIPSFRSPIAEQTFPLDAVACGPDGAPIVLAVLHAASFAEGSIAPDMIVSLFGRSLAPSTEIALSVPLPTTLAGTTLTLTDSEGVGRPLELFFVSSGQVNALIPGGTAPGPATLNVEVQSEAAASLARSIARGVSQSGGLALTVEAVAPGLFAANANGQGVAAAIALRVAADGTQSSEFLFDSSAPQGERAALPIDLGPEGEQVFLLLFGSGVRGFESDVTATVGGQPVGVLGAVAQPDFVGLDQINIGPLPASLAGSGEVDIILNVDGKPTNLVTVAIQ